MHLSEMRAFIITILFIYHTSLFKGVNPTTPKSKLFVNVVEERLGGLKYNIDFGGRSQGTKGEGTEMSTMQKGCHFKEVSVF